MSSQSLKKGTHKPSRMQKQKKNCCQYVFVLWEESRQKIHMKNCRDKKMRLFCAATR
jgi:hypothetical protein